MLTMTEPSPREKGLRILAKMIVRAYLGEIERGEAGPRAYQEDDPELEATSEQKPRKAAPYHRGESIPEERKS